MPNANSVFMAPKAASLSDPTSATTFKKSSDSTAACVVYFPQALAQGKNLVHFRVRAKGRATTVGSHNVTPKLSYGTSATAGSNTIIAAATARASATLTESWWIEADLIWNSALQSIQGTFRALNGSTAVADTEAVLTGVPTSVDLTAAGKGFTVEMTIATGGGDIGYLDELSLEVL